MGLTNITQWVKLIIVRDVIFIYLYHEEELNMKYVHWLKVDGYSNLEETASQFLAIENYLNAHLKATALLYEYDSGSFNWIVRLECEQCYDDLDMDVNSGSTRLERLSSKPKNIGRERIFKFPEHYRKYILK